MTSHCKKSCQCDPPAYDSAPECKDIAPECGYWKGKGRRKRELQRVHDRVLQENLRALLRELEFPRRTEKLMHEPKKHTVLLFCVICVPYDLLCYCSYRSYKTYKLKLNSSLLQYEIYIHANQDSKDSHFLGRF